MIKYIDYITIDATIKARKPCIKGTKITVYDTLGYLAECMSYKEIVEDFPPINHT